MGRKFIDLSGVVFERLTVLEYRGKKQGQSMWLCSCDCENKTIKVICSSELKKGRTVSCGCFRIEKQTKHGDTSSKLYNIYKGMKERCYREECKSFKDYGGRGITVCNEWLDVDEGYQNFKKWSLENGYGESLSIDRINNDGNYEPNNCKWSTKIEQNNNKRSNVYIEIDGVRRTIAQWAAESGIPFKVIQNRYNNLNWKGLDLLKPTKYKESKQSGIKGINWHKGSSSWGVRMKVENKEKIIGYFEDINEAIRAKNEYEIENSLTQ